MITEEGILSLPYYKKAVFTGSEREMCYLIRKYSEEEKYYLEAIWWRGPFCFEKSQEEKHSKRFEFSENGKSELVAWLNNAYKENKEEWKKR